MFGFSYLKIGVFAVAILAFVGYSYWLVNVGEDRILSKLKDDRITILQDGKAIDDAVLKADDDDLRCLLITCDADGVPVN